MLRSLISVVPLLLVPMLISISPQLLFKSFWVLLVQLLVMATLVGPSLLPVTVEEIRAGDYHLTLTLTLTLHLFPFLLLLVGQFLVPMGTVDIVLVTSVAVNMDGVVQLRPFVELGAQLAHASVALLHLSLNLLHLSLNLLHLSLLRLLLVGQFLVPMGTVDIVLVTSVAVNMDGVVHLPHIAEQDVQEDLALPQQMKRVPQQKPQPQPAKRPLLPLQMRRFLVGLLVCS